MAAQVQPRSPLSMSSKASLMAGVDSLGSDLRKRSVPTVEKSSREFRLSMGQVIVLWALIAGLLAMVFLFGLFAGREQGMQLALEQYGRQAVRLPVAMPVATPEAAAGSLSGPLAGAPTAPSMPAVVQAPAAPTEKEPTIDFKAKSRLENIPPTPPASLAATAPTENKVASSNVAPTANPKASSVFQTAPIKTNELKAGGPTASKSSEKAATGPAAMSVTANADAPAAKTDDTPKSASSDKVNLPKGWYVQVAAAKTLGESVTIVNKLKGLNMSAKLEQANLKSESYYRILVGPFATKQGANVEKDKVIRARASRGEPFVRLVE